MALIAGRTIVASATGATDHIWLMRGLWTVHISSTGWGEAALEVGNAEGTRWAPVEDASGPIVLTENKAIQLPGGVGYRLNVATVDAPITLEAIAGVLVPEGYF